MKLKKRDEDIQSLNEELSSAKERNQKLYEQFNQVNKEDHEKLLKEKEELEKEIENLKQQLGNMDSSEKVINLESDLKKLRDDYQSLVTQTRLKNAKLIEEQKLTTSLKKKR